MDKSSRQKSVRIELNSVTPSIKYNNGRYRLFHSRTAEYTFFFSSHGTFINIDYILSHNTNFNKFKRIEVYNVCSQNTVELN